MSKKNYYFIQKNVDRLMRDGVTNFLDPLCLRNVLSKLKGYDYNIYKPFFESERNIIFTFGRVDVSLIEIISYEKLSHREIMGSIYNLNIEDEMFGDIVINKGHYYVFVIKKYLSIIMDHFKMVGYKSIRLKEVSLNTLNDYERCYERFELIVSSFRVDNVVSKIIHKNREYVRNVLSKDNVFVNYEMCRNMSYVLKDGDIFSIRRYGKYRFNGLVKITKKNNYIIECLKYTEE